MHWYLREHQVVCEGDLDEDTRLDDIEFPPGHLCLDLEGIRKVNSRGIHTLINCLRHFGVDQIIEAERCSPTVVAQLNLLPGLSRQIRVPGRLM